MDSQNRETIAILLTTAKTAISHMWKNPEAR